MNISYRSNKDVNVEDVIRVFQNSGIIRPIDQPERIKTMIEQVIAKLQKEIGEEVTLILLSAPGAMEYYPKVGFEKIENGFIINRSR